MAVSEEPIKILEVKDGRAKILVRRTNICAHCHLEEGLLAPSIFETWVEDNIGARPGENVFVQVAPKKFLFGVFILYIIPLIGLFSGLAAIFLLNLAHSLTAQIMGAIGGFAISYVFVWRIDKWARKSNKFIPAALKIVNVRKDLIGKPIG